MKTLRISLIPAAAAVLAAALMAGPGFAQDGETTAQASLTPKYRMETSRGDIVLELDAESAPLTVLNFNKYVEADFYDNTVFHRVMPTFMIQGGGYTAEYDEKKPLYEPIKNEWQNGLKNVRGAIAMARLPGRADSATAQFFINVQDNPELDKPSHADGAAYAVFGKVTDETMATVNAIKDVETERSSLPQLRMLGKAVPTAPVIIQDVEVLVPLDQEAAQARASELEAQRIAEAEAKKAAIEGERQQLIDSLKEKHGGKSVDTTESGLTIIRVREGEGTETPDRSDRVKVHYRGTLTDGTQFDSSYDRGEPATFGLGQVIPGWTEGVGMMTEGEKTILIIPPDLGYGSRGTGNIPPDSTLVFEVELLEIL